MIKRIEEKFGNTFIMFSIDFFRNFLQQIRTTKKFAENFSFGNINRCRPSYIFWKDDAFEELEEFELYTKNRKNSFCIKIRNYARTHRSSDKPEFFG